MANQNIIHLTNDSFDAMIRNDKPVLVDFWAAWCGPCRMLAPAIDELADDYKDRIQVCKLNTDEQEAIAIRYRIQTIPTVMLFVGGDIVEKSIGLVPKEDLEDMIDRHLA